MYQAVAQALMMDKLSKRGSKGGSTQGYNSKLPAWANGVIVIGSVALVGFIVYVVYKSISKAKESKVAKDLVNQAEKDLKNWSNTGGKLTYANNMNVYNSTANTIQQLLDGCETQQTEIEVIKNIIHCCKNQGDWLQLVKVFGTRTIDNCGVGTGDSIVALPELLKDQLDTMGSSHPLGVGTITYEGFKFPYYTNNSIEILDAYFKSKNIQW